MNKLFGDNTKHKVVYYNDTKTYLHNGLYNIENIVKSNMGCPAIKNISNKLYGINTVIPVEVEFGLVDGQPSYKYNIDSKNFKTNDNVHLALNELLYVEQEINTVSLRYDFHTTFVTDSDIDIYIIPSPKVETINCSLTVGSWNIQNWTRPISATYVLDDVSKMGKVKFLFNEPALYVLFNKNIILKEEPLTENAKYYINKIQGISNFIKKPSLYIEKIVKHRPSKLL